MCFYAFPPFCIINKVLQKISEEKATGVMVIPYWPTQSWWPYLTNMLINYPLMLPSTQTTQTLPSDPQKMLQLLMCHVSGDCSKVTEFQRQLLQSSYKHGDQGLKSSTNTTWKSGNSTVVNKVFYPIYPNVGTAIDFLHGFYKKGLSYRTLNTVHAQLYQTLSNQLTISHLEPTHW